METAQALLRGAGGLLAVLGTVWVLVRVLKARSGEAGAAPAARLRVVARASLGRHASVVSVDAGDRVLVLGVGEHGVRLLAEQPALPQPVAAPAVAGRVELDTAAVLAATSTTAAPAAAGVPGVPGVPGAPAVLAVPAPRSAVAGSLVDPATWRAVVSVARDRTVRR